MNVILSIKPEYCEKIKNGSKKYEFRKKFFEHQNEINFVLMYSTSPVKKIVGAFKVETVFKDHPIKLWEKFKDNSGIEEKKFFSYFGTTETGYAIKIKDVKIFEPTDPRIIFSNFSPPQSYCYIKDTYPLTENIKTL
jgi:predicted transcriptional regulator